MTSIAYRQQEKPLHEYLRQHARQQPEKAAFVWYGTAISYGQLDAMSDTFAAQLHKLGVVKGDRVALFMQNCPQYVIAHMGIQKLGAVVGPCSPLFKGHELEYQLSDLGAKVIVAADVLYDTVQAARPKSAIEHVFLTHYADLLPQQPTINVPDEIRTPKRRIAGTTDFLDSLAEPLPAPDTGALDMDDVVLMTYTSGTTGLPKGAMLTYRNALFKTHAAADNNPVRNDDTMLAVAPLNHIAGMLIGMNVTIYTGISCVLLYRFDPVQVLQALEGYRVTWWYSVASMNAAVLQVDHAADYDLSALRINPCTSFGVTINEALAQQWRGLAPHCQLFEVTYGMSETHTWDTSMPVDAIKWGAHGIPVAGVECRVIDASTGDDMPTGEVGEVIVRSQGNFKGYWNKPEATASTLRNGWVHTGDMGKLDVDGYLTFTGRFKEMIKVSGYSVFPEEVESIVVKHPAVAQVAVIGIDDPLKGQVVKAVVVLRKGGTAVGAQQLIDWCREQMSAYKVPREIEFREALPTTGTGKVLRRLLKDTPKVVAP
ncbi:MAG: AMP-binding protein [Delftia acidovorans]|uniref:AMP-binding protein n=1 Tax=Delftia sp. UME58 TaxID=1862322 RepID=UPI00160167FB|nr:AMP-binding protein [Delftia sp. UME58]MBB1652515.1 AMP-dependent synthetase [Delftia sp. UME58]MBL8357576.1 AMP-binding protein [Delftia acidovorans]